MGSQSQLTTFNLKMASEETLNFQTFVFEVLFIVLFLVMGSWTIEVLRVMAKAQAKRDDEADGFPFPVPEFRFFPWRSTEIGYIKSEAEKSEEDLKQFTPRRLSKLGRLADKSFSMLRDRDVLRGDNSDRSGLDNSEMPSKGTGLRIASEQRDGMLVSLESKRGKDGADDDESVEAYDADFDDDVHVLFGAVVTSAEMKYLDKKYKHDVRKDHLSRQSTNERMKKKEIEQAKREVGDLKLSMPLLIWGFCVRETFAGVLRIAFLVAAVGVT